MTESFKIILDVVILAGLGGFIFYALKLSRALNAFRAHRNEFDSIMRELTQHIDDAQIAVNDLKRTSQNSGDELHKLVRDAQFLTDELQQINEIGESLASRLENAAERGQKNLTVPTTALGDNVSPISQKKNKTKPKKASKNRAKKSDDFMIHDPDYDDIDDFSSDALLDNETEDGKKLSSAAERELYDALKKNKK